MIMPLYWAAKEFIFSPLGRWLAVGVVVLLTSTTMYVKGRYDCSSIQNSAILQTQITNLKSQLQAASELAASARIREENTQEFASEMSMRVADYEEKLKNTPAARSCGLTRSDVDRLRNIATGR